MWEAKRRSQWLAIPTGRCGAATNVDIWFDAVERSRALSASAMSYTSRVGGFGPQYHD
jgi:hypothetical protein